MPLDEGHDGPVARNCECGHVLRATLVVVKRALIPILYLWIIAKLRQHKARIRATLSQPISKRSAMTALGTLYFLLGFRMLNPYSRCHPENHRAVGWNVGGLLPLTKHSLQ